MVNYGSNQHKKIIEETVDELNKKGYYAININGVAPDAIAIKDNKIYAVEILLMNDIPKNGWKNNTKINKKRDRYSMFDDVIFKINKRKIKFLTDDDIEQKKREKKAEMIVNNFIKEYKKHMEEKDERKNIFTDWEAGV